MKMHARDLRLSSSICWAGGKTACGGGGRKGVRTRFHEISRCSLGDKNRIPGRRASPHLNGLKHDRIPIGGERF